MYFLIYKDEKIEKDMDYKVFLNNYLCVSDDD